MTKSFKFGILLIIIGLALFGATLPANLSYEARAASLIIGLLILAAGSITLSSKNAIDFKSKAEMRPDLIVPNGVALVMGTVFVGLGVREMIQVTFTLPVWNWFGFIVAIIGMLILIPARGMFKMKMKYMRMMKKDGKEVLGKTILLITGLLILAYGFHNVFNGLTPFTGAIKGEAVGTGFVFLLISFAILIGREFYKTTINEMAETKGQMLTKEIIYIIGILVFFYGYMNFLGGKFIGIHTAQGFAWGLGILILGLIILIPVRMHAKMNEKFGMMEKMKMMKK